MFYSELFESNPDALITIENPCPQNHDSKNGNNVCLFEIRSLARFLQTVPNFLIIEVCYCQARIYFQFPSINLQFQFMFGTS